MAGTYHKSDATVAARKALAITPTDGVTLPVTRSLYIGTGGTLVVRMAEDEALATFTNVPSGFVLPLQVMEIRSTGTTATNILALW